MGEYWTLKQQNEDLDEKTVNPFTEMMLKEDRGFPKRKPLKVALFDLDGTLIDTEGQYSIFWGGVGRKYNLGDDFADRIKGSTLVRILTTYFPDESLQKEITAQIDAYEEQMKYEFFPGALDFLRELKSNGIKCAVVTSSNQVKMASVKRQIPDFDLLFDRVLTSEDFARSKPAPDCYLLGAQVFGADLDECVVFEDAFSGLQAGMDSGIFTVGLATYNTREAILGRCHYILDNFCNFSLSHLTQIMNQYGR